ncbi:MAG: site-specific DNA-methyltransferase [Thermodesulfobacteriales bacterium]|nr:MAG: site-specific DNA-methyltransferase [Thermodesulfobacteriales bacterium]
MVRKRGNDLNGSDWAKYSLSVWNDIRKSKDEMNLKHPAMFPLMLVGRLIMCFTTKEELRVLDPFMGSGSTLVGARNLGRYGIGFELNPEYIKLAESRLTQKILFNESNHEIHNVNASEIPNLIDEDSVDICITSPPYWDILLQKRTADYKKIRHYGEEEGDLGHIRDYQLFIKALADIFAGVYKVLKPGKYCIVNVMDLRKKDQFYPFHADLATSMKSIGFIFDDLIIWDRRQEYNNLRALGYPSVFRLNKIHEFILIFKKPS